MPKVKHRHSKERGRKRRTHYKAEAPSATKCGQCGKLILPHKVCPYCGYYGTRQIKRIETIEQRKEKQRKKQQRGQ
jgi:large subunit ribosomal protein L32